jgi:threonine dehydratase
MADVQFADVARAAERIAPFVHRTPLERSASIDRELGVHVWFKCEQFQKTGSFKFRGACNAVLALPEAAVRAGVVTHSSGNHAQALARAAQLRGLRAYVVMPTDSVPAKKEATLAYGAHVVPCAPSLADRERVAAEVQKETGAYFVHPYDEPLVIAGQGTVGLELLDQLPDVDAVIAPVGGGGLLSGLCLAIHGQRPSVALYAAEPAGADDAARSLRSGERQQVTTPVTIADGLRAQLSERTFAILRQHVEDVIVVEESEIVSAMRLLWERTKWVVEPSAAVALAALRQEGVRRVWAGRTVAVVLTGGNADLDALPWLVRRDPV